MDKPPLTTTRTDVAAALARGLAGAVPIIGALVAEAVTELIPNQKLDRVIRWLQLLDERVSALDRNLEHARDRLRGDEGLDLFEDGIAQAARALSDERREHLANLLARSLTQEEMKYAESKKLLNILRDLTDPEIIMLMFYSATPTMGSKWHQDFIARYPEVLKPVSRAMGSSQEEIDRGALQDSYRDTLLRLGLLQKRNRAHDLTALGALLLRYLLPPDQAGQEPAA